MMKSKRSMQAIMTVDNAKQCAIQMTILASLGLGIGVFTAIALG